MVKELIFEIEQKIAHILNNKQIEELHKVLVHSFFGVTIYKNNQNDIEKDKKNEEYLEDFITAKRVEGCSEKTIKYYDSTIKNALETAGQEYKSNLARLTNLIEEITSGDIQEDTANGETI